jgi:hypothetical protein
MGCSMKKRAVVFPTVFSSHKRFFSSTMTVFSARHAAAGGGGDIDGDWQNQQQHATFERVRREGVAAVERMWPSTRVAGGACTAR